MQPIPLSSLSTTFDVVIALWTVIVISIKRKSIREDDKLVSWFVFGLYFWVCSAFFFSLPGIIIFDLKLIQVVYTFGNAFVLVAMRYFLIMPLKIFSKKEYLSKVSSWILLTTAGLYTVTNLMLLKPVVPVYFGPFIDWRESTHPILQALVSLLAASVNVGIILLFAINGWFHKNELIRKRSRIYAIGFTFILSGWLSIFLFTISVIKNKILYVAGGSAGCILISIGMILLLFATMRKKGSMIEDQSSGGV